MSKPKVLIEQWLPIDQIGAECMRERGASSALPPLYFLHVWWARRPLTVSRAAILASLLPAYPTGEPDIREWPDALLAMFPTFTDYKQWFLKLIGIQGDPAASRRIIQWAKIQGVKLTPQIMSQLPNEWTKTLPNDMGISIPYGYRRAFTHNPSDEQLETLNELLAWAWEERKLTFCDPMSGGGSIPFEAIRFGLTVHSNELNPVASIILKATLDFPARFGSSFVEHLRKYGDLWAQGVNDRLADLFPQSQPGENIFCYVWSRTIPCPSTGNPIPLSPNWWLRKGATPIALKVVATAGMERCSFEIVEGKSECAAAKPDSGTVRRGTGISPWTGEAIENKVIKSQAIAGKMGQQLYAVGCKGSGGLQFRLPTDEDAAAFNQAAELLSRNRQEWIANDRIPSELLPNDTEAWTHGNTPAQYGATKFTDVFSERQLLAHVVSLEELLNVQELARSEMTRPEADAVATYLAIAFDKCLDYNSRLMRWDGTRDKIVNTFSRHDFAFKWSHAEFDAARNLVPWAVDQICDAYRGIAKLSEPAHSTLLTPTEESPVNRLTVTNGPAQDLPLDDESIQCITVDPPYYDNVNYAELSDFFYVWQKRTLANVQTELHGDVLAPKDEEAVANPARFAHSKKKKLLAEQDYENKMSACFREMHRVLHRDGVLTVMFTHKRIEAWDTLGSALIGNGFQIDASWPVHTESEYSLHQAKKNSAASTIMLVCRKRAETSDVSWWDDLKSRVRSTARDRAKEFERQGIRGVDLYISTFGPVLSIISEHWPVLTSETDSNTGDPLPLKPGEALDLAREEVVNLRKQGLLLGRTVEFDPVTDWYLMAWDAFRAEEFPSDEARKLALALGLDLERDVIRDKRLVSKKSGTVVLCQPVDRRKKGMVDEDAAGFPHLVDSLHTAMMIYTEEGSKACQVFVDRHGLRDDSRLKALVQAMMEAIPTTRDKKGEFIRPEMTTLDAMRVLFWEDLSAPKEEAPIKPDAQKTLFDEGDGEPDE